MAADGSPGGPLVLPVARVAALLAELQVCAPPADAAATSRPAVLAALQRALRCEEFDAGQEADGTITFQVSTEEKLRQRLEASVKSTPLAQGLVGAEGVFRFYSVGCLSTTG